MPLLRNTFNTSITVAETGVDRSARVIGGDGGGERPSCCGSQKIHGQLAFELGLKQWAEFWWVERFSPRWREKGEHRAVEDQEVCRTASRSGRCGCGVMGNGAWVSMEGPQCRELAVDEQLFNFLEEA